MNHESVRPIYSTEVVQAMDFDSLAYDSIVYIKLQSAFIHKVKPRKTVYELCYLSNLRKTFRLWKRSCCINNIGGVWSFLPLHDVDHFGCIIFVDHVGCETSQKRRIKATKPTKGNWLNLAPGPFSRAIIEGFRLSYLKLRQRIGTYLTHFVFFTGFKMYAIA